MNDHLVRDRLPQHGLPSRSSAPSRQGRTGAAAGKGHMRTGAPRGFPQAKPATEPPSRRRAPRQTEVVHPQRRGGREVRGQRGPRDLPARLRDRQHLRRGPDPGRPARHPRGTPGEPLVVPGNNRSLDRPHKVGHDGSVPAPTLLKRQQGSRRGSRPQGNRRQSVSPSITSPIGGREQGGAGASRWAGTQRARTSRPPPAAQRAAQRSACSPSGGPARKVRRPRPSAT